MLFSKFISSGKDVFMMVSFCSGSRLIVYGFLTFHACFLQNFNENIFIYLGNVTNFENFPVLFFFYSALMLERV